MQAFLQSVKKAFLMGIILLVICGLIYPLALTGVSQLLFPSQANGSMLEVNGTVIGSRLIGQQFTDARFFQGRPSAVGYNTYTPADLIPDADGNTAYGGVGSGSNNYSATNPALVERVQADLDAFLAANPEVTAAEIPTDLLTASGSGLDPHISPAAAAVQIPAIAKATGLSEDALAELVAANTQQKTLGIFGEPRVNVLETNLAIAQALGLI